MPRRRRSPASPGLARFIFSSKDSRQNYSLFSIHHSPEPRQGRHPIGTQTKSSFKLRQERHLLPAGKPRFLTTSDPCTRSWLRLAALGVTGIYHFAFVISKRSRSTEIRNYGLISYVSQQNSYQGRPGDPADAGASAGGTGKSARVSCGPSFREDFFSALSAPLRACREKGNLVAACRATSSCSNHHDKRNRT